MILRWYWPEKSFSHHETKDAPLSFLGKHRWEGQGGPPGLARQTRSPEKKRVVHRTTYHTLRTTEHSAIGVNTDKILFKDIVEGDDVRRLYCVQLVLQGNYLKSKCEKGAIKKAVHQEHLTFEMKWRFNHWRILGASFVSNGSSLPITLMRARNSQKKYLYAHLFQTCFTTSLIYDQLSIISGIMMGSYNSLGGFKYFLFQIQT